VSGSFCRNVINTADRQIVASTIGFYRVYRYAKAGGYLRMAVTLKAHLVHYFFFNPGHFDFPPLEINPGQPGRTAPIMLYSCNYFFKSFSFELIKHCADVIIEYESNR